MIKAENLVRTGIAWIPEIPADWELKRIKLLFDFNKNIVGKTSADFDVLSLTTKGVIKRDLESGMGKFPASFDGYQIVKPNSIMLCLFDMDVTPRVVGHVDDHGIISAAYTNIIPKKGINAKYYYYHFLLQDKNKSLLALGTGIRITLNKDFFGTLKIPVPPLSVQNSIVAYLDKKNLEIDKFIRNKEKLIELLEEEKRGKINIAITKGIENKKQLQETGIEWLGQIPADWSIKKLKYITKLIADGTHVTPSYVENGFPFLRITDVEGDNINWEKVRYISPREHKELTKSRKGQVGDILLSKNGTIGKVIEVTWKEEFSFFVSLCLIRFKKVMLPKYFSYFFKSDIVYDQLNEGSKTTSVTNLHLEKIKELKIAFPEIEEQKRICNYLDEETKVFDTAISKAQKEISSIKEYREALMTDLVTGKRSVQQLQMS
jgi:type I restriction enzyme, S subunit